MSRFIVSTVRVYRDCGRNARIRVFNRGEPAGELIVEANDAGTIAERLFGELPSRIECVACDINDPLAPGYDLWRVDLDDVEGGNHDDC